MLAEMAPRLPLYRLIEDELRREIFTAIDMQGFFVPASREESSEICLVGVSPAPGITPSLFDDVELQVLSRCSEVIGSYYVGRIEVTDIRRTGASDDARACDLTASFFGYASPFPFAGDFWRKWAAERRPALGEWKKYPIEAHDSWLHVVQTAWFGAGRSAIRYSEKSQYEIDGGDVASMASFYCALGEAVNGPGGYFGSNLDALADCLSRSEPFLLAWRDSGAARESLGSAEFSSIIDTLREFKITVVFR
ncbi:barstar family protein [Streptomyces inhibens]|uniref:barstar family protein n=1 Tax=Streptomyces inhibens TaxID=2293571 RepID=UPI001EE6B1CF|nr:barstar family protein [Streptomyces inhibens]UKY51299.1 barstar family protein [Streptomyces inhibens]